MSDHKRSFLAQIFSKTVRRPLSSIVYGRARQGLMHALGSAFIALSFSCELILEPVSLSFIRSYTEGLFICSGCALTSTATLTLSASSESVQIGKDGNLCRDASYRVSTCLDFVYPIPEEKLCSGEDFFVSSMHEGAVYKFRVDGCLEKVTQQKGVPSSLVLNYEQQDEALKKKGLLSPIKRESTAKKDVRGYFICIGCQVAEETLIQVLYPLPGVDEDFILVSRFVGDDAGADPVSCQVVIEAEQSPYESQCIQFHRPIFYPLAGLSEKKQWCDDEYVVEFQKAGFPTERIRGRSYAEGCVTTIPQHQTPNNSSPLLFNHKKDRDNIIYLSSPSHQPSKKWFFQALPLG